MSEIDSAENIYLFLIIMNYWKRGLKMNNEKQVLIDKIENLKRQIFILEMKDRLDNADLDNLREMEYELKKLNKNFIDKFGEPYD